MILTFGLHKVISEVIKESKLVFFAKKGDSFLALGRGLFQAMVKCVLIFDKHFAEMQSQLQDLE